MISKMLDWKIQLDLTHVKTIQYDAVGRVLDCFYTRSTRRLGFSIQHILSLWINIPILYCDKQSGEIKRCARLDNLSQQVYYYAMLE